MSSVRFFVREYIGPGDWVLVSRLLLDSYGQVRGGGNKFVLECSGGAVWLCEFHYDELSGEDDMIRRVRVGHSERELLDYFDGLGFGVVLPVDHVLFE